jgi:long-chain-fatty-acid--CoA ligase ACSBG
LIKYQFCLDSWKVTHNKMKTKILNGKVLDSEKARISDPTEATKIVLEKDGIGAVEPISIPALMNRTVEKFADHPALNFKNLENEWETITYRQYKAKVDKMAKVFIKLGLEKYHSVAVLAFNSPEWLISELAAIHAGGIITGVYTTNSPEAVYHVLKSSRAQIVVVDEAKQLNKIREINNKLPELKAVIQTGPLYSNQKGYYRWAKTTQPRRTPPKVYSRGGFTLKLTRRSEKSHGKAGQ